MAGSADQASFLVVLSKGLVPKAELQQIAEQARLASVPLLQALEKRLDAEALKRVVQTLARHGRPCAKCGLTTYLLPRQNEANTQCEHCGGSLLAEGDLPTTVQPVSQGNAAAVAEASDAAVLLALLDTTEFFQRVDPLAVAIPGYTVVRVLSRGGMGRVLVACDAIGQEVAIKVLHDSANEPFRLRFQREERLLKLLDGNAGFVSLLSSGETADGPYLIMPLLRGGTLRDRLRGRTLEVELGVTLLHALATAIGRAHEVGVVHRDLKPENVLFDSIGRPFIADLGLAKHFRRDVPGASASISVTKTGEMLGTKGYMPFEQRLDAQRAGPAADVFALGAILYECLSGVCPPFAQRRPLAELCPGVVPGGLSALVERALAFGPEARFPDGAAFARALEETASVSSRPPLVLLETGETGSKAAGPASSAVPAGRPSAEDDPNATYVDGLATSAPRTAPDASARPEIARSGPTVPSPPADGGSSLAAPPTPDRPGAVAPKAVPAAPASEPPLWVGLLVALALGVGLVLGFGVDRLIGR